MHVAELWRYPVKSLRGEQLDVAEVRGDGIVGDRLLQVRDGGGRLVTARTRQRLLGLRATLGPDGTPLVEGSRWDSAEAAEAVRAATRDGGALAPSDEHRFDDTPLLVATDGTVAALGIDRRRLRPNVVVAGVEGLAERGWEGRSLRVGGPGGVEIAVRHLCERCGVTTIDPDTIAVDPDVLRRINDDLGGRAALNCTVARPGRIAVGDRVVLV